VENSTTATPGWYPDPTGPQGQLRYFDGRRWTEHRAAMPSAPPHYAPPQVATKTTPDGRPLASWGARLGAWFLDALFQGMLTAVVLLPLWISLFKGMLDNAQRWSDAHPLGGSPSDPFYMYQGQWGTFAWLIALSVVLQWLYVIGFWRWKQATPGKLILGLRIEFRDHSGPLTWGAIFKRWLVQYATALVYGAGAIFQLLDGLWPLWDERGQALHEKWPGTNVVRKK
jgi:uncharacterized RDD family membrane protein YckC